MNPPRRSGPEWIEGSDADGSWKAGWDVRECPPPHRTLPNVKIHRAAIPVSSPSARLPGHRYGWKMKPPVKNRFRFLSSLTSAEAMSVSPTS